MIGFNFSKDSFKYFPSPKKIKTSLGVICMYDVFDEEFEKEETEKPENDFDDW
ncbi:MAG: hypothetical protein ABIE55_01920 [Candidatus Aenigmatarchaeota archaeon]